MRTPVLGEALQAGPVKGVTIQNKTVSGKVAKDAKQGEMATQSIID